MSLSIKPWIRGIATIVLFFVLGISVQAQANNTLYFMKGVPQANRVNPAYQPQCKFYIGIPMLAPAISNVSSNSLAWNDLVYHNPVRPDSLITFLHPEGSKEAFLNNLRPVNLVISDIGSSLISCGFRTEVGFFTMDITSRWDGNVYIPGDLPRMLIKGAGDGEKYDLNGIGADLMAFDEISVGWSGQILDNLTIGARAKLLFGIGNITTKSSNLSLTTSTENWHLVSDMQFNASLPFAEVTYDEDGNIGEIEIDEELKSPNFSSISQYMFNGKNLGFGLDLGVNYRPLEELQLSLSVVDLGFIHWKDEVHQLDYTTEYDFTGFELNPFELSDDYSFGDFIDSSVSMLSDSLASFAEFTPGTAYSKRLNTKLYIGVSYDVTPSINFGLLSRTDFLNGSVTEQVTASANFHTGRILNFSLSYSYMSNYFRNIGAGISLNAGPVNLYLVSDNALNVLFWPDDAQSANIWFGFNLLFGYKDKPDLPLVY